MTDQPTQEEPAAPMTRAEVQQKLGAKLDALHTELRRQLEHIANMPGHTIQEKNADGVLVDRFHELSVTWKQGQAIRELSIEFLPLIYPEPAKQWTEMDQALASGPMGPPS